MVASKTTTTGAEVNLAAPSSSQSPSSVPPGEVVVDVAGAVRRPGIQRLPAGSRVIDAVKAAGGVKMGQAGVNLARVLVDGEQIVIGAVAAGSLTSGSTGSGGSAPVGGQKVNLNTATATQLEELPRIGPSKAAKIIEFRNQNGGFRSVEQLREIAGIGDVTFSELSQLVSV
jgi:competence protein ComEA